MAAAVGANRPHAEESSNAAAHERGRLGEQWKVAHDATQPPAPSCHHVLFRSNALLGLRVLLLLVMNIQRQISRAGHSECRPSTNAKISDQLATTIDAKGRRSAAFWRRRHLVAGISRRRAVDDAIERIVLVQIVCFDFNRRVYLQCWPSRQVGMTAIATAESSSASAAAARLVCLIK